MIAVKKIAYTTQQHAKNQVRTPIHFHNNTIFEGIQYTDLQYSIEI